MSALELETLRREFQDPSEEYGAIPWWCWTGDIAEDELERQMRAMQEQGLSQFFIFPYGPQDVKYLSEEWFDRVGFVVEKAQELGMRAWIYDEWDWPSGIAGGKVTEHREYRARTLAEFDVTSSAPGCVEIDVPLAAMKAARLERVLAAPLRDGTPDIDQGIDLTGDVALGADGKVAWEAPDADWMLMALVSFTPDTQTFQGHYVDLLNPEATRCFIRHTHEAYYERLGKFFGTTIPGFFMDECFYMSTVHGDAEGLDAPMAPWTPRLEKELAARGVAEPGKTWWAVFHDVGTQTKTLRALFWNALSHLLADSLYGVLAEWCEQHNVVLTGHGCESSFPYHVLAHGGTHFPQMAKMQIPGIDMLGGFVPGRSGHHYRRSIPKLSTCVSHHKGQKRCFAEAPNLLNWEATLAQIKGTTDWLAAYGINMFCPCAFMYTQFMHRHSPEPFGYQWPHWEVIKPYFDYVRRISYLLSQGRHVCDVAVYHPMLNVCAEFDRREDPLRKGRGHLSPMGGVLSQGLNLIAATLLENQIDFDYVYDEALREATVKDGELHVGDDRYSLILLPPFEVIAGDIAESFNAFAEAGIKFLGMRTLPSRSVEVPGMKKPEGATEAGTPDVAPLARIFPFDTSESGPSLKRGNGAAFVCTGPIEGDTAPDVEALLLDAVSKLVTRDVLVRAVEGPTMALGYTHRRAGDTDMVFLANPGEDPVQAEISLAVTGGAEAWDPETGTCTALETRTEGGRLVFERRLDARESLTVVVHPGKVAVPVPPRLVEDGSRALVLDGPWSFRLGRDNALPIDTMIAKPRTGRYRDASTYEIEFSVESVPERVALLVDCVVSRSLHPSRGSTEVKINGESVGPLGWNQSIDRKLREADITTGIRPGKNVVTLVVYNNAWFGPLVQPTMMVIGKFRVLDGDRLAAIESNPTLTIGSWADQDYPCYSGAGIYTRDVELPAGFLDAKEVFLTLEDCANVAAVSVNGRDAGVRLWPPYRFAVKEFLQQGANRLEIRVMNSMANMMLGQRTPAGLTGPVRLAPAR